MLLLAILPQYQQGHNDSGYGSDLKQKYMLIGKHLSSLEMWSMWMHSMMIPFSAR